MKTQNVLLFIFMIILLSSCAQSQHNIQPCLNGTVYGFWGGLWHGIISPFSFIGSLFSDDISMYAVNNNGRWYTFGFVLGSGILISGASKSSKK